MSSRSSSPASPFLSLTLGLLGLFFPVLVAPRAIAQSAATGVEVVYFLEAQTLQTYDVDRQTGDATQEGQGVTLDSTTGPAVIVPSADDHFLYVTGYNGGEYLWVYATDATGVPQVPPIQTLSLGNSYSALAIDPNRTLAYAVYSTLNSQGQMVASIYVFSINPTTGMVTAGPKVATDPPNGPCKLGADFPDLWLMGFNTDGTQLYDFWFCPYHDTESATYYSRTVNQKTGALGPETPILNWGSASNTSTDLVNITPSTIILFTVPNDYQYGISSVSVYPLSGRTKPLFTCNAAMLEACGYGTWDTVDPSGKYIFLQTSTDSTEITKLELTQKKIVDTGNYVDGVVKGFSPDDVLIYTEDEQLYNPWPFSIYVFDPVTGTVTYTGAQIVAPIYPDQVLPAVRR